MLEILVGAKYHVDGVGVAMGEDVGGVRDIEQGKVDSVRTSSATQRPVIFPEFGDNSNTLLGKLIMTILLLLVLGKMAMMFSSNGDKSFAL